MIFKNSVILITGASSGIGLRLAKDLVKYNAKLALVSRRVELLTPLLNEYSNRDLIKIYKCDVRNQAEVSDTYIKIKKDFGKIDIAILNSGVSGRASVLEFNSKSAEEVFETNLLGVVYLIEKLLPDFIESRNGYIVGVSSLADGKGFPRSGFYSASKAALTILLESLRIELKPYNVKVITVKPGFVKTAMTDKNEFYMPFLMDVEKASRIILKGLEKDKRIIEFPFATTFLVKLIRTIPTSWFEKIASVKLPAKKV